jgi:hypothetical protein
MPRRPLSSSVSWAAQRAAGSPASSQQTKKIQHPTFSAAGLCLGSPAVRSRPFLPCRHRPTPSARGPACGPLEAIAGAAAARRFPVRFPSRIAGIALRQHCP